jgi:hypothetical protein
VNNPSEDERPSRDDAFLAGLFARAEEEIIPTHPDYNPDEGLERFLDQLGSEQHADGSGTARRAGDSRPAPADSRAGHLLRESASRRAGPSATRRNRLSVVGSPHRIMSHPVVASAVNVVAALAAARIKWSKGTARVRDLVISPEGWVLVEMEDGKAFSADPEHLQGLHVAWQAGTPIRYWVNNFLRVHGLPRGGVGDIPSARQ